MSKTTFLGYVPSLKSKHEATIVGHKAIQSKGGSIRYTLQGEYQGRKTLPKTVSKADFEGIYGFDAKAAEAVIIRGYDKDGKFGNKGHEVGITEKDGFTPDEVLKTGGLMRPLDDLLNHADTVGSPSPASVEPSAPSEKPFPQEPSNENFSAEHTDASELLREEEEAWVKQYDEYMEHPMEDIEASYLQGDMVLWTPTLEEFKKGIHEDRGIDHEVYLKFVQDLKDGKMDLITGGTFYEVKEAFGFGKDEEPEEEVKEIYDFFDQVFPQKAVREYILLLLSSFLGGTTRDEKFHIWTGVGGNGKSKLLELIEFALGDYSCKLSHTVLTRKQSGSSNASPDIEQTKGKRLASIQETEQDDIMNVGRMKELSGGDKIYARGLFKDPIQFKPQFKMILLCNELPKINADDNGTWRRIRVVKFVSKFVDNPKNENEYPIDPLLSEKIYKWKEALMYILLQKYKKYKKYGLKEPEEVLEVTRDYQRVSDLYNDFITDSITKDEKSHIGLNELYRVFKEWFRNNNNQNTRPPTRTYFKGKMEIKLGQKYEHNKWTGFKIIGEDEDTEEDD